MANLKFRYLIVVILLTVTIFVVYSLRYDSYRDDEINSDELQEIPMQFGDWQGQDLQLDEMVFEILETNAIIHRNYMDKHGNIILLSIVHYHDTKVDFHAPEACLGGLGLSTTKTKLKLDLELTNSKKILLEVAQLLSKDNDKQLLSYYFYKSGDFLGQNYIQLRLNIAVNKLLEKDSSGSLIRVSTSLNGSKAKASRILINFLNELLIHFERV